MSSDIIYESENLSNTTDKEIQYDSDLSASDSGNSFENENEEHSVDTEMLFLVGVHRHSIFEFFNGIWPLRF